MSAKTPMKSILKQTPERTKADEQNEKAEKDKRHMSIALNHASRIDAQKKIELQIVLNIEKLMDLPTSSPAHPPSAQDAAAFTTLVYPFQPSDFASLVEERRINGSCGYALCANPPRSETLGASASWKLKGKGAGDFCSTDCVRKALYVKAQLSEVPAWERVPGQQAPVVLPEADRAVGEADVPRVAAGGANQKVADREDLAAERGERPKSFKPKQVMMESVVEKARSKSGNVPSFPQRSTEGSYGAIEGYESKFSSNKDKDDDSDSDAGDAAYDAKDDPEQAFTSEILPAGAEEFGEEEEAAWREMQRALAHLNAEQAG